MGLKALYMEINYIYNIGQTCAKCGKKDHIGLACRSTRSTVRVVSRDEQEGNDYVLIPRIMAWGTESPIRAVRQGKCRTATVRYKQRDFTCIIDTGAEVSVLGEQEYNTLSVELTPSDKTLYAYSPEGDRIILPVLGKVTINIVSALTRRSMTETFYVVKGRADNLLSCSAAEQLGEVTFAQVSALAATPCPTSQEKLLKEYEDRFAGIGKMKGVQVKLHINPNITPVQHNTRRVPFHQREAVEEELDRLQRLDIIEPAEGPTPWVSPIVVVHKAKGVRICLDSRAINEAIERERHPMPTIEDLIVDLNGAKVFSKIDLNKGYHQLELHPDSRYITVFTTHKGLYRYKRLSLGINSAAEVFQKAVSDMLRGIPGTKNISDDIIVYSQTIPEHLDILRRVFQTLRENSVTVNREKCELLKPSLTFYGHTFSGDGVSADKAKVSALLDAPPPTDATEVRSLLGTAQYMARFIPSYADVVAPLLQLTHKEVPWRWGKEEQDAFERLKSRLAQAPTIKYFNIKWPTELVVDASPVGLGAILTQRAPDGEMHTVAYASRKLSDVESRYSQTEREALAAVWAAEHFHLYLYGASFVIITDHKPLLGIFKASAKPTARLDRMCLRLLPYKWSMEYRPGKTNPADFLSRHPVPTSTDSQLPETSWVEDQIQQVAVKAVSAYDTVSESDSFTLEDIRHATSTDDTLQQVITFIESQKWHLADPSLQSYKNVRQELSVANGLVLRGDRVVVPGDLQERAVRIAHRSHQGIVKTKSFLRQSLWFPGLDKAVESTVSHCLPCQAATSKPTEVIPPLRMSQLPSGAWQEVSIDFTGPFKGGEYLLVVTDDYSRWPEVEIVYSTSAQAVFPKLDAIFSRVSVPVVCRTDNGPPFNGHEFARFARTMGFEHRKITPLWPRANGEVERFMRTLKKAVQTAQMESGSWKQELHRFLRHYRATPHSTTGQSPSELLYGRKLRTELPSVTSNTKKVTFTDDRLRGRDERMKRYMKELADARNHASQHDELHIGDTVLVKRDGIPSKLDTPYVPEPLVVKEKQGTMVTATSDSSKTVTRNESLFKKVPSDMDTPSSSDVVGEDTGPRRSTRIRKEPAFLKDFVKCITYV